MKKYILNDFEKYNRRKQVISLIVLIITIIVIVVLATAVILSIANNNPIENAQKAQSVNNQKSLEEAANLEYTTMYTDKKIKGENIDYAEMTNTIRENLETQGFSKDEAKKVEVTKNGLNVLINLPAILNGFVVSKATGESNVSTGLVIYEGEEEVTDENVEIAIETRNQFVWVPVDDIDDFVREDWYYNGPARCNKRLY